MTRWFLLLWIAHFVEAKPGEDTLKFVEIWFRHGERLPTHYVKFPKETLQEENYKQLAEPGELTNRGIGQEYKVGTYLREIYGDFLGDYTPSQIYIWTGEDNRTVTSAQAVMAGLYPPPAIHQWSNEFNWQPTAMHTDASLDWLSTGIEKVCPSYESSFFSSSEAKAIPSRMNTTLLKYLSEKSGVPVVDLLEVNYLIDSLLCRILINDTRFPFPDWAEPVKDLIEPQHTLFHSMVLELQNATVGGYHLEQLLSYLEDHIKRPSEKRNKAVFLSGHDANMMAIGKAFNIPRLDWMPLFGALTTVELHVVDEDYIVKFFKTNGSEFELEEVSSIGCPSPCKLQRLKEMAEGQRISKQSMYATCKGGSSTTVAVVTGSLLVLCAVLLLSTLVLCCTTCSYKKQVQEMKLSERTPLLDRPRTNHGLA